jgi:hypothetical protein
MDLVAKGKAATETALVRALTPEQREAERQARLDAIGDAYVERERRLAVRNPNLREARGARSMTYLDKYGREVCVTRLPPGEAIGARDIERWRGQGPLPTAAAAGIIKSAAEDRDMVAAKMTPAQIAEAQKLAREWKPK